MATIIPPDYAKTAGIPSQSSDTIVRVPEGLITGDVPAVSSVDMTVAASQTILALTPLGLNGDGDLVPAVNGTTQAIGICPIDIVTDASATKKAYPIYRTGTFNPDMLLWPASYDTATKRMAAFRGAPTPTQIIMRPVKAASIVLP